MTDKGSFSSEEYPSDIASRVTDRIVHTVETLRTQTTKPILTATKIFTVTVFISIVGVAVLVLISICVFRLLDTILPGESWSAYLVLGTVFIIIGSLLWLRRNRPSD